MYLLGRVIDRGTATRTAADIAEALDGRGISLGVSVSRHLFSLTCTCLAADVEPVFSLLGEIVTTPSVPESELATRKAQVVTGLRQDEDNPAVRAVDALLALLYGADHPYGRRIKGTAESVDLLTRERLLILHASRFGPAQLSAVVVGDVEPSHVEACAEAVFGGWRNEIAAPPPPAQPRPASGRRCRFHPDDEQGADRHRLWLHFSRARRPVVLPISVDEPRAWPVRAGRTARTQHPRAAGHGVLRVEFVRRVGDRRTDDGARRGCRQQRRAGDCVDRRGARCAQTHWCDRQGTRRVAPVPGRLDAPRARDERRDRRLSPERGVLRTRSRLRSSSARTC